MAELLEQSGGNETYIVKYNHLLHCAICLVYACYLSSTDDKFGNNTVATGGMGSVAYQRLR